MLRTAALAGVDQRGACLGWSSCHPVLQMRDIMPRRVCFGVWTLLASLLFLSPSAWAQQQPATGPSVSVSNRTAVIGDLLSRGQALENERRWGEALTLYEDALRQYPTQRDLEQRMQLSRMHYDL